MSRAANSFEMGTCVQLRILTCLSRSSHSSGCSHAALGSGDGGCWKPCGVDEGRLDEGRREESLGRAPPIVSHLW